MNSLLAGNSVLPIDDEQSSRVQHAVAGLSPAQLQWVSGYVAGLAAASVAIPAQDAVVQTEAGKSLTILFGSQTGNGEAIASALSQHARDRGFQTNLVNLANYKSNSLKRESLVTLVISTHGEGDPPDDAELFHEFLLSKSAPKLASLRYSVLALGDSSYINFCETGRELDARLAVLGAERLAPIVECDLDYEDQAAAWVDGILERLPELLDANLAVPRLHAVRSEPRYDKRNPFVAEVLANQKITGAQSTKDVRHIELSLEGSGIHYEPGDSLAVVAPNPPQLVKQFLDMFACNGDDPVAVFGEQTTVAKALASSVEITAPSLGFLKSWAEFGDSGALRAILAVGRQDELSEFMASHQIIDIVRKFPADITAGKFVSFLRKLSPRSYSIASSLNANPDEAHLTVAAVRYETFGSEHWGSTSTHLADRLAVGDSVSVYVEPNSRFRLPADPNTPIIMIGPGTGVAPFRAFVEERIEQNAAGKNWLMFGDRNFRCDFLYQLEWQRHLKQGHLHRLDVAFSRDRQEKIYVQDRILENAKEIHAWIVAGANIYVCGDSKHMAGDVDNALADVLVTEGNYSRDDALAQLKELRRAGRYQRDVY